jgi:cytochrome c553
VKRALWRLVRTAGALGIIAFLGVASGVYPIGASSGHWGVTRWFLQFAKQRAVSTHSLGIDTPPLDDSTLVLRGAAHYESGCRPCHGAPGTTDWEPAESMTPSPPPLAVRVSEFQPRELFYITKHGLKLTGMPAFPSLERDEEVWAVVAFMLRLPAMPADEYRQLALGEAADTLSAGATQPGTPQDVISSCARCHGFDGRGRDGAFPALAGQSPHYLAASLAAFAQGDRASGMMQQVAGELDEEKMRELAAWYAAADQERGATGSEQDSEGIARGAVIAVRGVPNRKVPSCMDCHGIAAWQHNPVYPRLAGQHADYIVLQLRLFRENRRGGTPYHTIMNTIAKTLTPQQMADVASYYESLGR